MATLPPFTPVGLAFAPDGRIFVWQKAGTVRIFKNGALLPAPFINISARVNQCADRGLLGLALDPNFAANGFVYLLYTVEAGGNPNDCGAKTARLSRVTADPLNPDLALAGSEVFILDNIPSESLSHTIGTVRFAPDGKMFVSVGDGASFDFADSLALRAQSLDSFNGKILRINPDGSAPPDNPFYDGTNSIRSKVWAYGLRNPFRFGLHPTTGEPYIGDVGWTAWEEVNRGRSANFGWPCYEGNGPQPVYQSAFVACQQLAPSSVTPPLHTYDHFVGSAVIGGVFYSAILYPPEYRGNYFFADYESGWLRRMTFDAGGNLLSIQNFAANLAGPVDIELGPDGQLYFVALNTGEVRRIRLTGGNQPPIVKASATPTSGYSPLNVSFSSAGSVDPEGAPLTYLWDFGDSTTSTNPDPAHSYVATGVATFTATLTVTDNQGAAASATVKITIGSLPPVATILAPANGTRVKPNDTVVFQGSATDPDEGPLPPTSLSWTVLLHHNTHIHPYVTATGSGGSFVATTDDPFGTFAYEIILTATDSSGLTDTKSLLLPVDVPFSPFVHIDFTYPDRSALLAAGWDFQARTASGLPRDTEQTAGSLVVSYDQVAHPGTIRVPLGAGEIWESSNNSQNTLFRDLPSDWTSLRLKIAVFAPTADYQQVGLIAYQNDDAYLNVQRNYNASTGGQVVGFFKEVAGVVTRTDRRPLANTGNLILRMDRDPATDVFTGYYSVDGGASWVQLTGAPTQVLTNPRLAIQVGSDLSGTFPTTDLAWVEILR